jgi:flagellin-like hook-associated protein FlgL
VIDAIKIVNGVVQHQVTRQQSQVYTMTNNDQKRDRTVLVEHQRNIGWDLIEPTKPYETTDSLYRFEMEVPAAKEASLTVTEQRVLSYTFEIGTYGLDKVTRYQRRGKMSKQVADAITKAMGIQADIGKLEDQIRQLDSERKTIGQDQDRLRQNMQSIDRNSDLYARYMKKLGDQETRLEQIEKQRAQAQSQLDDTRAELASFVKALNVK